MLRAHNHFTLLLGENWYYVVILAMLLYKNVDSRCRDGAEATVIELFGIKLIIWKCLNPLLSHLMFNLVEIFFGYVLIVVWFISKFESM